MNDPVERQEVMANLSGSARAIARAAENEESFRELVDAFRANDGEEFQRLLGRLKITDCELVCFWLRSKECVLECMELCGPPREPIEIEQIPAFAQAIAKIAGDEKLTERLAEAALDRDGQVFKGLVEELKLQRFCYLLCHWVCAIRWRLACEVVCSPRRIQVPHLVAELRSAGAAIQRLAADKSKLDAVIKGVAAFDCIQLQGVLSEGGDCRWICEWICSWHCAIVCLPVCRPFLEEKAETSIAEMRDFAQACGELVKREGALQRLVEAELAHDEKRFAALVREYKLERYCLQLCHWICFAICHRFCICVCPPPTTVPLFTHVGKYRVPDVYGDFNANGTTSDHGFAFTQTIDLKGILPDGQALDAYEYRFTYKNNGGGGTNPILAPMVPATVIGQLEYWEYVAGSWQVGSAEYWVNNPGATANIAQNGGPALTPSTDVDMDANGWIAVPRDNNFVQGGTGRFVPTGVLAGLDTTKLTYEPFDLTTAAAPLPLKAGDAMPSAQESAKPVFTITFETRVVTIHNPHYSNARDAIALSNTWYTYNVHPDWAGSPPNPPRQSFVVLSVDIVELIAGGGCNPLGKDLHALFTAYHPYLATLNLYLEGPAPLPPLINPPISALGESDSGGGGKAISIAGLKPCAYILWLTATLNLTNGYIQVFGTFDDHIAFCKH